MNANTKVACSDYSCQWHGYFSDVLRANHPFIEDEEIIGCPDCKESTIVEACDEPNCWEPSTCGFPTPEGYRRTCGIHYKK